MDVACSQCGLPFTEPRKHRLGDLGGFPIFGKTRQPMTGSPSENPSPPQDPGKPDAAKEKLRSRYEERAAGFSESIRRETRHINYIALARLAALVAAIWVLVLGIRHQSVPLYALTLLLTAGFLFLVSLHNSGVSSSGTCRP